MLVRGRGVPEVREDAPCALGVPPAPIRELAVALRHIDLLERTRRAAAFDDLTGLASRQHFMHELARETERVRRQAAARAVGDSDDDADDGDWSMDVSEKAVKEREAAAAASFEKIEAASKVEDLDEFELEKREIGLAVKGAWDLDDEVSAKVKALMGVAREHSLQCDDLMGFIFEFCIDEDAIKQLSANKVLLYKMPNNPFSHMWRSHFSHMSTNNVFLLF